MKVPFLDLRPAYLELKAEIDFAVARVLGSGRYILGEEVELFESEWASYCDAKFSVGVGNGLDALYLALSALGVGPGDEVIVPSHTFIATWLAVSKCGATPVPVEPDVLTYNMDPKLVEEAITLNTKVILPVHMYGRPADLDPILAIARKHQLFVVEDAAQAHGSCYKGRRIGAHSDVVCWSFYPGKNLGALGDGGAITTDDEDIADRVRLLRNYGSRVKYINELLGINSRLDPLQAAVLRVKLGILDEWNCRRKVIADHYFKLFHDIYPKYTKNGFILPVMHDDSESSWHLFVIRHRDRDSLKNFLEHQGIETNIHYPVPPHRQRIYSSIGFANKSYPLADHLSNEILSLPIGPHLTTSHVEQVVLNLCI